MTAKRSISTRERERREAQKKGPAVTKHFADLRGFLTERVLDLVSTDTPRKDVGIVASVIVAHVAMRAGTAKEIVETLSDSEIESYIRNAKLPLRRES